MIWGGGLANRFHWRPLFFRQAMHWLLAKRRGHKVAEAPRHFEIGSFAVSVGTKRVERG